MACACKARKNGQVSAVKQVVKKTNIMSSAKPTTKNVTTTRRVIVKRPI